MIRRTTRIALEITGVVAAGLAVAIGVAAWRLSNGPISLRFLSPYVEEALSAGNDSFRVRVDDTVVEWGGMDHPIEIRGIGLRVREGKSAARALVPAMAVRLSMKALLRGVIAPTSVELIGPDLRLVREASGRLALGAGGSERDLSSFLPHLVDILLGRSRDARSRYLSRIRIRDARLAVDDRYLGRRWEASQADLAFERDLLGVKATAALRVDSDGGRQARFRAVGVYDRAKETVRVGVTFGRLDPAAFAAAAPSLAPLRAFRIPLEGTVNARFDVSGELRDAQFRVRGEDGTLTLPRYFARALAVKRFEAQGHVAAEFADVTIERVDLELGGPGGGPSVTVSGDVMGLAGDGEFRLGVILRNLPVDDLKIYWPPDVAVGGRRWMLANTADGLISEVSADLRGRHSGPGGRDVVLDSVTAAAQFQDATIRYMKTEPPVRHANGTATFTIDGVDIRIADGESNGVAVGDARVLLTDFREPEQHARITARVTGDLSRVLELLDRKPYGYVRALGIDAADLSGAVDGRLALRFPLIDALALSQVDIRADARVTRFRWKRALDDIDLTDGDLRLGLDKSGMKVTGTAHIAGAPVDLVWLEPFGKLAPERRRMEFAGTFDDAARSRLGLDLGGFASGPVDARVTLTRAPGRTTRVEAALDLTAAWLDLPALAWEKPPALPATAQVSLVLNGEAVREIPRFSLKTTDLAARGNVRFAAEGGRPESLAVKLTVGDTTDVTVAATRRPNGGYRINVTGNRVDVSRLLAGAEKGKTGDLPPFSLETGPLRLYFATDRFIDARAVTAEYRGGDWRSLVLRGTVGEGKSLSIRYGPKGDSRVLMVRADDAGATLKALDLLDTVVGGTMEIKGAVSDAAPKKPFAGKIRITDYRVVNAPVLAKLFTLASFKGIGDVLAGNKGIGFSDFAAAFRYADDTVEITRGRAKGSEVGITVRGTIDFAKDKVDLRGTLVPAYTLNSILGNIPILGPIFVGEEGSGVFAATYALKGPLDDPEMSVNPLAALTPGFLRVLFGVFSAPPENLPEAPDHEPYMNQ